MREFFKLVVVVLSVFVSICFCRWCFAVVPFQLPKLLCVMESNQYQVIIENDGDTTMVFDHRDRMAFSRADGDVIRSLPSLIGSNSLSIIPHEKVVLPSGVPTASDLDAVSFVHKFDDGMVVQTTIRRPFDQNGGNRTVER